MCDLIVDSHDVAKLHARNYTLEVHDEDDGDLWAHVLELPGCFASGRDMDELLEAAAEAIGLYLSDTTVRLVAEHLADPGDEGTPIDLVEHRCRRERAGSTNAREVRYSPHRVGMVVDV